MSREQRDAVDAMIRRPPPEVPPTIEQQRAWFADLMATMPVPDGIRTSATTLAERPALRVDPVADPDPGTLLYLHGGAFALGSPQTALSLTGALVARTGVPSLSLDYRLAPEHPYPAGLDDCVAAYRALLEEGVDPGSVVLAGDSAGGGLAVAACLRALREGLPGPAGVVTFSAGLDHTRSGGSVGSKAGLDPFFTAEGLAASSRRYLAGADPRDPFVSPAAYADLTGFPPLLLQVGTNELLLDDSTRLAARAVDAGVDVVLDVTADVPHVFQTYTGLLDEANEALDRAALFVRQRLAAAGR